MRTLRDVKVGDIVVDGEGLERRVLAMTGELFAYSWGDAHTVFNDWLTFTEAEREGWRLKEEAENVQKKSQDVDIAYTEGRLSMRDDILRWAQEGKGGNIGFLKNAGYKIVPLDVNET